MAARPLPWGPDFSSAPEPKVAFAALRHREHRKYLFVILAAQMGDKIEGVIGHWRPFLLFAVFFGAGGGTAWESARGKLSQAQRAQESHRAKRFAPMENARLPLACCVAPLGFASIRAGAEFVSF
jgi:hypothetical protein